MLHVGEHGSSDGEPIVFLHGAMVAGWMWSAQAEGLPQFHSLLVDLPGMGHSAGLAWTSLADTADHVAAVISDRCVGQAAHVVGLSLGGLVGLHVAARHPDSVASLLVSGVPAEPVPASLRFLNRAMVALYSRPWGARIVGSVFGIPRDESMTAFVDTARLTDRDALRCVTGELASSPLPERLHATSTPTLAVVGAKDTALARRGVVALTEMMPDARGFLVPGVGHQWNAEDPQLFTDMIRTWITECQADPRLQPA